MHLNSFRYWQYNVYNARFQNSIAFCCPINLTSMNSKPQRMTITWLISRQSIWLVFIINDVSLFCNATFIKFCQFILVNVMQVYDILNLFFYSITYILLPSCTCSLIRVTWLQNGTWSDKKKDFFLPKDDSVRNMEIDRHFFLL